MSLKKTSRGRTRQSNLSNFAKPTKSKLNDKAMDANASTSAAAKANTETLPEVTDEPGQVTLTGIMEAINSMKTDLSSKFDGILPAIENVRHDIKNCSERVTQAEVRISATEDEVNTLQEKVESLEGRNKDLEEKLLDLEARSCRSNIRLVNLPEGAEGNDMCGFLEGWIPEVLEMEALRGRLTLEGAHRLGPRKEHTADSIPRTLIMKFLNYRDKEAVMRVARAKGKILYKNQAVRFYQDMAADMHKKMKVCQCQRSRKLHYQD